MTVAALERHTGAGRLTLDEFAERARIAHQARTQRELAAVISDLPVEQAAPADDAPNRKELLLIFALAAIALVLLGIFLAVSRA